MEITYTNFSSLLKSNKEKLISPLYLVYGETFLCEKVFEDIRLLLDKKNSSCTMEGPDITLQDVLEELNTYSLLSDGKLVILRDSSLLDKGKKAESLAKKAEKMLEKKKVDEALDFFLSYLSLKNIKLESFNPKEEWMQDLLRISMERKLKPGPAEDEASFFLDFLEKGFPENHHLFIFADSIDRRRTTYKKLMASACLIDCSLPAENNFRSKKLREEMLKEYLSDLLNEEGSSIRPEALDYLLDLTGLDLALLVAQLEKLMDFTADKKNIALQDVKRLVRRTRQDPIFVFTDAVIKKNLREALLNLKALLAEGMHPLQLLSALLNQFRKLLFAADFLSSPSAAPWNKQMSYSGFQAGILPELLAYERELSEFFLWESKEKAKDKDKLSDILIASNAKNPYSAYQLLLKADNFGAEALKRSFLLMARLDLAIKSGSDANLLMEDLIISLILSSEK